MSKLSNIINIIKNVLYPQVKVQYLPHYKFNELSYAHELDCCFDLRSCNDDTIIKPKTSLLVNTGIKLQLPTSGFFELQIRPRSGLSTKNQIIILNSPGTVDSGYRGEIKVGLYNLGSKPFTISYGDRIAQAKVALVPTPTFVTVSSLNQTTRGSSGFGSSGVN